MLLTHQFGKQNWTDGLNSKGRPNHVLPDVLPSEKGALVFPGIQGAINWHSTSYNPLTGLLYLPVREVPTLNFIGDVSYSPGDMFLGSRWQAMPEEPSSAAVRAMVPQTGEVKWEYPLYRDTWGGLLSTAGNLVFSGTLEGQLFALDSATGKELWRINTGGRVNAAPITYLFEGKQLITMAAGNAVFTFGLE